VLQESLDKVVRRIFDALFSAHCPSSLYAEAVRSRMGPSAGYCQGAVRTGKQVYTRLASTGLW
jgi:hypothetical protein